MDVKLDLPFNYSQSYYSLKSPYPQQFSFDYPFIKYLLKNPSTWIKLIQTCKYFFSKNPIYAIASIKSVNDSMWIAEGDIFYYFDTTAAKLWVYEKLEILKTPINVTPVAADKISLLIPKLFKCELRKLDICYQNLKFAEYQFLTSSGTLINVKLVYCTILYSDGTSVTVDELLEKLMHLETFEISLLEHPSMFTSETPKNIAKILPHFQQLDLFELNGLRQDFNFSLFTDFLMINDTIRVCLKFFGPLPVGYKQMIFDFIDSIIENPPKRLPDFVFEGSEENGDRGNKYKEFYERQFRYNDFSDMF